MYFMRTHRTGLLTIDHRSTVGMTEESLRRMGLPLSAGKGLFEAETLTCGHCRDLVVLEPRRTRERTVCRDCSHYICDKCGLAATQGVQCKPLNKLLDELYETELKKQKDEETMVWLDNYRKEVNKKINVGSIKE
jgi:hypothetical protein